MILKYSEQFYVFDKCQLFFETYQKLIFLELSRVDTLKYFYKFCIFHRW